MLRNVILQVTNKSKSDIRVGRRLLLNSVSHADLTQQSLGWLYHRIRTIIDAGVRALALLHSPPAFYAKFVPRQILP